MFSFIKKLLVKPELTKSLGIYFCAIFLSLSPQKLFASSLDVCNRTFAKLYAASRSSSMFELMQDRARLRGFRASSEIQERFLKLDLDSIFSSKFEQTVEEDIKANISSSRNTELTLEERYAIWRYGGDAYWPVNKNLRLGSPHLSHELNIFALMILSGLNKLPDWQGITYRRFEKNSETESFLKSLRVGSVVRDPAFMSTSPALEDMNGHDGFLLRIHSRTGVNITSVADAEEHAEVLFRPNTKFLVFNRSREILPEVGDVFIIDLYEMPEETASESGKTEEAEALEVPPKLSVDLQERDFIFTGAYVVSTSVKDKINERKAANAPLRGLLKVLAEKFPEISANQKASDAVAAAFLMDKKLGDTPFGPDFIKTKLESLKNVGLAPETVKRLYEEGLIGSLFENDSPSSTVESNQMEDTPLPPVFSTSSRRPLGPGWQSDQKDRRFYLKEDRGVPEGQTAAEVISSQIYRKLGYETPATSIVIHDGKRYSASSEISGATGQSDLTSFTSVEFRALRFFAAYLKDWDRLQIGADGNGNNFDLGDGKFVMIDFGGTLGFRAMGGSKPSSFALSDLPEVGGFELTHDPDILMGGFDLSKIESDGHPWKNLKKTDYQFALERFKKLSDEDIVEIVKSARYSNPNAEIYMIDALITRRDGFIKHLQALIDRKD